jgi:hypothetical protein
MSSQNQSDLKARSGSLLSGALKHVRTSTLAASLIPVALVTAVPMTVVAQQPECGSAPLPPCQVPEPSSMLFVGAGAAATLLLRRRSNRSGS